MINLLKERHIGDWCKRGAWIIAAMGLIEIVLGTYSTFQQASLAGDVPLSLDIVSAVQDALSIAATTLFYFLILYGAGLLANHFAATSEVAAVPEVGDAGEAKEHEEVR